MAAQVRVFSDVDTLNAAAARHWVDCAADAIAQRGAFHVALSGGSTPRRLYALLASEPWRDHLDWSHTHIWFGDERAVAPDHPDSNYRMACEALLDHVPLPVSQVHRIEGELPDATEAAQRYAAALEDTLPRASEGAPQFDLMLLGMGPDGHTASLFPGSGLPEVRDRPVAAAYVEQAGMWRISLTLPVINAAHQVLLLVAGADKASMLARVLGQAPATEPLPVELIAPQGDTQWFLDGAAARQLEAHD